MQGKFNNTISSILVIVLLFPTVLNLSHHHHGESDFLIKSNQKIDVKCKIRDYQALFISDSETVLPDQKINFIEENHALVSFPYISNFSSQSVLLRAPPVGPII